jgi:hypothetical protein
LKTIENELATIMSNYERLQRENAKLNEDLTKSRYDLEQIGISNTSHKQQVNRNTNNKYIVSYLVNTINGRSEDL